MEQHQQGEDNIQNGYEILVNNKTIRFSDPEPIGSQILAEAGFEPADECVLIAQAKIGSRLVSLDEGVRLEVDEIPRFYAFHTGEVFMFTVDEHGFQWGRPNIIEHELRELAKVTPDEVLILQSDDDEPRILAEGEDIKVGMPGTEHFRTVKRLVKVFFDNVEKDIARGVYTTEQLLSIFSVQPGYLLNLVTSDGLTTLKPNQRIHVKDGMKFFDQVPGGGSS